MFFAVAICSSVSMIRSFVVLISLILLPSGSLASSVSIAGSNPRDEITLVVRNAKIGTVLRNLAQKYDFSIQGLEKTEKGEPLSLSMSGDLEGILQRVLRNWNYLIVRSPNVERPIEKVMILDSAFGTAPMAAPPSVAAVQSKTPSATTAGEPFRRQVWHHRHRRGARD